MDDRQKPGRAKAVPSSRLGRLAGFGAMTAGIAGRTLFEGAKRLSQGELPDPRDLLLTPTNILKLSDELSRMRGAALKMGQLISMDAGEFLPPELAQLMTRLRADADFMPQAQLISVLNKNWGKDWQDKFEHFDMKPIAAASIGQVHRARTIEGEELAIKVQYPGVKQSIDSDIDNVVTLFKMSGMAPPKEKLAPLVADAKIQLHGETDYLREAQMMRDYGEHLETIDGFILPTPNDTLTTQEVLAMEFLEGRSIEKTAFQMQDIRDDIVTKLIRLCLEEVYHFQLMQSDPNFANYIYNLDTKTIGLLDFGATLAITENSVSGYKTLIQAGMKGDREAVREAAIQLGIFSNAIDPNHEKILLNIVMTVFREIMRNEIYDFTNDGLVDSLRQQGMELAMDPDFQEIPPTEIIYLQRKVAGMYLLGRRLKARVPLRAMLHDFMDE
jgi:predicted unusual protein kinase regulating ubiquinone biosynthesis (AarF/ABC1/UbiB family)